MINWYCKIINYVLCVSNILLVYIAISIQYKIQPAYKNIYTRILLIPQYSQRTISKIITSVYINTDYHLTENNMW